MAFHLIRNSWDGGGGRGLGGYEVGGGVGAVAVGYDGQVEGGGEGAYLDGLAQAAAPVDVGLEDVHGALFDYLAESPTGVFVFAAGDVYGGVAADRGVAVELVGQDGFFQPADVVVGEFVSHFDGVRDVPGTPGVEHDVHVVADGISERPREFQVSTLAIASVGGAVSEEPLGGGVALFGYPCGAFGGGFRLYGEAEHTRIRGELGSGRAAEQCVHGLSERLALEVPESAVHDAYGHHGLALATVNHGAVHDVPEALYGERVLAEEQRPERGVYDERLASGAGAG